jgi:hypothetical protein
VFLRISAYCLGISADFFRYTERAFMHKPA